jgi:hypothetical protein
MLPVVRLSLPAGYRKCRVAPGVGHATPYEEKTARTTSVEGAMTMPNAAIRVGVAVLATSVAFRIGLPASARAAEYVTLKIFNDTHVPITQLYDVDSRQDNWGINDLQAPVQPGHYFYIRLRQNSYAHCPGILHDVKLIFANGATKVVRKIDVCKYDLHVDRP